MNKKVAIIGGGIFGAITAINFAKQGYVTDLYEKNSDILMGATANSQNRLHLGLHYPRDLETAIQSKEGFVKFKERFPSTINSSFPNYYSTSLSNSKINDDEFRKFAYQAGINITEVKKSEVEKYGIRAEKISTVYRCEEAVIDIDILREIVRAEILHYGVNLKINHKVSSISSFNKSWEVVTADNEIFLYDLVFKATYGSDHIVDKSNDVRRSTYEYHSTLILEIKNPYVGFGFTVIDGDFITLLPKGFSGNQLLYAPSISTMKRFKGEDFPTEWNSDQNFDYATSSLLDRLIDWFAGYEEIKVVSKMQAIRAIQPNMERTDKRTSSIRKLGENYYEMWSGKIDHCIDIADEMLNLAK